MGLRELASAWIRATSTDPEVTEKFETKLDDALRRNVGCSFMLGSRLTTSGVAYATYCHAGELFTFPLPQQQAARIGLRADMLVHSMGATLHNHEPHPEAMIKLDEVSLDSQTLRWEDTIAGSFKCSTSQPWMREMCLEVAIEPPGCGSTILRSYFGYVPPGTSTHRFSVSCGGLAPANAQSFAGILPLFVQICVVEEEKTQALDPWHPIYGQQVHATADPFRPHVIGDPYVSPPNPFGLPPGLAHVLPAIEPGPPSAAHGLPKAPPQQLFKAASDIRAVIVEIGPKA
jgi:hypothetical protein